MPILGDFSKQKIGMPMDYFEVRDIVLDCRYPGAIEIDPGAMLSIGDKIITLSHAGKVSGTLVERPVKICKGAWIGAFAVLYNCTIGENSIVGIGSVVASRDVPPNTMVEGNPAKIIAELIGGKWTYLSIPIPLKRRHLVNL